MKKNKIVGDAIFGFITLKPHIINIIDTPEFQRLRMIWHIGLTPFVYPTANHSVFEHSIGTYFLASKLIRKIQKQLNNENAEISVTENDVKCVEIAALCCNIDHGPFSYVWETHILPSVDPSVTQGKNQFDEIWQELKNNNKTVQCMLNDNKLEDDDEKLISALVRGTVIEGKEILFNIVHDAESGLDVEKWDGLARNSTYLGHSSTNYRHDIERMLRFVRAIKDDKNGKWKIAFRETERLNILRVYQLRDYLNRTAIKHRVVVALELMMIDGIKRCVKLNIINKNEIKTVNWILQNTDTIFWSNINKIEEFKRILRRDLYKPILEAIKYEDIKDLKEKINELQELLNNEEINAIDIRFGFSSFKLTDNAEINPMCNVLFYKRSTDRKFFKYTKEDIPSSLNANFNESKIIVFATSLQDNDNSGNIVTTLSEYLKKDKWRVSII